MDGGGTVNSTLFRAVCGRFATGVAVATTQDAGGGRWGLTVNSFSSVSLDPPLILFSIDRAASSHDVFSSAHRFGVNILSTSQKSISDRFSFVKDEDRFDGIDLVDPTEDEPPLIAGSLGHLVCELESAVPGGDHTILIGKVRRIAMSDDPSARPLLYFAGGYADLAP